jgi:hypothetical protein
MTSRTLIVAACFALAAGCQARKTSTHARAEPKPQTQEEMDREGETLGEAADDAAEKTREAANATVDEAERAAENTAEATRDAADDTLAETDRAEDTVIGENETLPPEPGVDMPETGEETPDPDEDATAEVPAPALGTEVTARVENIDRKQSHVVFTVQDDISEIRLQSGKEIKVPFNDLRLLTGMEKDKAIEVLEAADSLKVRVLGVGDAMRIVEIEIPEEELKPVRGEEKRF